MPSLVVQPTGRAHPILRKLTSIGSDRDNDLVIDDDEVGPTHAHIRLESGRFVLHAQSRAWPLRVNGKKVRKHALDHGDELTLGDTTLKFNLWDDPSTTAGAIPAIQSDDAVDELTAYRRLAEFTERLAVQDDLDRLLALLMDEVVSLVGADKGFLLKVNGAEIQVAAARDVSRADIDRDGEQISDSIVRRVLDSRQPLIISDALNDAVFKSSESVMQLKLCSVMCVPLLFGGQLLGLIYVGNDNIVNLFDDRSLEVLTVFAGQAALLIQNAIQKAALRSDNARLRAEIEEQKFGQLIGACDPMKAVFRRVEKVAGTDINVLILGETGTGKELIAHEIHRRSRRADGPFVAVNCGAIPENLMESELFGHRRGAFTGAVENKTGSFQQAHGGTLFLDEIGEMPVHLQVKLLRAIQERTITRVGDSKTTPVDIRLVCATHVDLEAAIKEHRFREDLYYRINVVSIPLPPLRERDEDVVLIARYLLDRLTREYERPVTGFSQEAIIALRKHTWPGNIRELENRLKKAIVLADGAQLTPDDLDLDEAMLTDQILPLAEAKERFQMRYIDQVLALNDGNRTKTARDLGVDPRTVFRHLEKKRNEEDG